MAVFVISTRSSWRDAFLDLALAVPKPYASFRALACLKDGCPFHWEDEAGRAARTMGISFPSLSFKLGM